jgi:hypothetical protein
MKTGPVTDDQQTKQCVCTASLVVVAGVTPGKQAEFQKYALRSTNITGHRVCLKIQN